MSAVMILLMIFRLLSAKIPASCVRPENFLMGEYLCGGSGCL